MQPRQASTASPLNLLSSMATRALLQALVEQYAREFGVTVRAEADGGLKVAARVRGGETIDVIVLAEAAIEELIVERLLLRSSKIDLVRSGIAIAVRADGRQLDVSSRDSLQRAVQEAGRIGYSTGPSGRYLEQLFTRWGILESLRTRITVAPAGTPVASLIANGAVDLGFQQLSELLDVPGIRILGPLPAAIQTYTIFSGAVSAHSTQQPAARALLRYLESPAHAETLRRFGMAPVVL